ncbi:DinB family protein [Emticicia sp. 17c]|uniref:DinB family protein n=1 Tax=Emticicia sp. 17c TaxID=3127704 RepID=UPI00301CFAD9
MKTIHTEVIKQLTDLLEQLPPQSYAKALSILNGSSIGQHCRHIIEFYECLLKGYQSGIIDYDARQRNFLTENDVYFALDMLKNISQTIEDIADVSMPLLLAVNYNPDRRVHIPTSFIREMAYLIEHSIHHFALIRIGLQENFKEVEIPENFGVAYSTIQHRQEQYN